MNWADEPATETQLDHLGHLGHRPGFLLTKGEASHLIAWFDKLHASPTTPDAGTPHRDGAPEAYLLRLAVASFKRVRGLPRAEQSRTCPTGA